MELDLNNLKLSQSFDLDVGVKKVLINVPVRRPDNQWFIQVHPDENCSYSTAVIELKEDRETYLVAKELWGELQAELKPKVFVYSINKQGNVFLWPIKLPSSDGQIDDWNKSALEAAQLAKGNWCRIFSNKSLGSYDVKMSTSPGPSPVWPEKEFSEILKIAFKDKYIDSLEHVVVKKLRGEI